MDQRTARRQPAPRLRTNLDTDFLKLIAILSMLLDHIGAVFFPEHPAFRWVGRLAFPIFCYCMTVGLLYTRDIKRYLGRLGLFALISQPCYILATHPWDWQTEWMNWNIFFTLFLSLLAMWGFQTSGIELLEASTTWFELGGMQFNVYSSVQFSVNGKGWSTDFKTIARDTAYDEKE